ncbi:MAG: endopeptidase La [Myxococcota bacterium]|nr:endopeptidase La [Myxococcota bacterium]
MSFTKQKIPVFPLKNSVIFPVLAFPVNVKREADANAIEAAKSSNQMHIAVFTQKDPDVENPGAEDLHEIGTLATILKVRKMPGDKLSVIIKGESRIRLLDIESNGQYLEGVIEPIDNNYEETEENLEKISKCKELALKNIDLSPHISQEISFHVRFSENPSDLADIIALHMEISYDIKQEILAIVDPMERIDKVISLLEQELHVLELSNKIQSSVKGEMDKAQREYFLREQMKAIQRELGEVDDRQDELDELKKKIRNAKMPDEVEKVALKELKRLSKMNPSAAESTVARTYIDWLVDIPWNKSTKDILDIQRAGETLDRDHFGLEKVKKRILEFLAVRKLKNDMKGPILCLVGPPGVGKTSLAKSVASAMGRELVRMSLGGVRDEAEIRGHRRTYIGSMPGKVIKGLKKAGANNPVFVLDEIDKLGADYRGDPSSALLEVLDPEQNDTFMDHYLDVTFDLSKVLFIATANLVSPIPAPLRDRMEMIEISGYTMEEKLQIAFNYIIPEQMEEHGITDAHVEFEAEGIRFLIESYTREAGVRSLKREVAALCRYVAKEVASENLKAKAVMNPALVEEARGPIRFFNDVAERTSVNGVATGLAWTASGGDILFIEATKMRGKGQMKLSGSLGDVMKESVGVASSYIRASSAELGIDDRVFDSLDIHIHVPSGAIPKDGPSAGVTMLTAIVSLLTGLPVDAKLAMTGEATLRGAVLPVGGIKEKVLAAHRAGIKRVILPEKNRKDLPDIPEEIQADMEINFCSRMENVLDIALGADALKEKREALSALLETEKADEEQ